MSYTFFKILNLRLYLSPHFRSQIYFRIRILHADPDPGGLPIMPIRNTVTNNLLPRELELWFRWTSLMLLLASCSWSGGLLNSAKTSWATSGLCGPVLVGDPSSKDTTLKK